MEGAQWLNKVPKEVRWDEGNKDYAKEPAHCSVHNESSGKK